MTAVSILGLVFAAGVLVGSVLASWAHHSRARRRRYRQRPGYIRIPVVHAVAGEDLRRLERVEEAGS